MDKIENNNCDIQINFYGECMTINLPESYDLFKSQISSYIGVSVEELNLFDIFYRDEDNIKININNNDDFNELFFKVTINQIKTLNIEYRNDEKPNNNFDDFNYKENFSNDININDNIYDNINYNLNNNLNINSEENKEIIFPVMCDNCKQYSLKNIIYYCQKCKHYVCENCFKLIFRNHIHSYNVIGTLEHFNNFSKENENINNVNDNFLNSENNNDNNNDIKIQNDIKLDINDNSNNDNQNNIDQIIENQNIDNLNINMNNQNIDNQIIDNQNKKEENINSIEKKEKKTSTNNGEFLEIDYTKDDWGICPITNDFMENPVITIYGTHYEKYAIIDWLKRHQTDPLTNQPLTEKDLTEDEEYKKNIKEYRFIHDL